MQRIVFTIIIIITGLVGLGIWQYGQITNSGTTTSYLHGVDVSHYQGVIDWNALAEDDTAFVFIKATEGVSHVDPRFDENWRGARRVGLPRGAYHYFTLCETGRAQAEHFIATVQPSSATLPPVVDLEDTGACSEGSRITDVPAEISDFIDLIETERDVRPILYTNHSFYEQHLSETLAGEQYWLRSFSGEPDFGPPDWLFWQYTDQGRRRGISGPVDLNAFAGDAADLRALTNP